MIDEESTALVAPPDAPIIRSKGERIAHINREMFIRFPQATRALHELQRLIDHPQETRMPCLLIYGPTGIGKTKIIQAFQRMHPRSIVSFGGRRRLMMPTAYCQMPADPEPATLLAAILQSLDIPYKQSLKPPLFYKVVCQMLLDAGVRILFIDELNNLNAAKTRSRQIVIDTLKNITNDTRIPIVAIGTGDSLAAIRYDSQMAHRFEALELSPFDMDQEFRNFLLTYVANLPLEKTSNIDTKEFQQRLLALTYGITVNLIRTLKEAAIQAILTDKEMIDLASLDMPRLPLVAMTERLKRANRNWGA